MPGQTGDCAALGTTTPLPVPILGHTQAAPSPGNALHTYSLWQGLDIQGKDIMNSLRRQNLWEPP